VLNKVVILLKNLPDLERARLVAEEEDLVMQVLLRHLHQRILRHLHQQHLLMVRVYLTEVYLRSYLKFFGVAVAKA
jgi:hypothetical protein